MDLAQGPRSRRYKMNGVILSKMASRSSASSDRAASGFRTDGLLLELHTLGPNMKFDMHRYQCIVRVFEIKKPTADRFDSFRYFIDTGLDLRMSRLHRFCSAKYMPRSIKEKTDVCH